jgi:homoserine O-acetyltransferase
MLEVWLANDVAAAAGMGGPLAVVEGISGPGGQSMAAPSFSQGPGPVSDPLAAALGRIQAATAVVAGRHDLYFPPADCAHEAALIPGATFHVLESDLGHRAGNPRQAPAEQEQLRAVVDDLLRR